MSKFDRRGFIKLAGLGGGIVFASSLSRGFGLNALGSVVDYANAKVENDFYFIQLSDTHWGFAGPKVNPDAEGTLKKAVKAVNSLEVQPDFIVFTGDLTHTTDDVQVRKDRMSQFKDIVGGLKVPTVHFMRANTTLRSIGAMPIRGHSANSITPSITRVCISLSSITSQIPEPSLVNHN